MVSRFHENEKIAEQTSALKCEPAIRSDEQEYGYSSRYDDVDYDVPFHFLHPQKMST